MKILLLLAMASAITFGQTIESRAIMLKGASTPATCSVGERFFLTTAAPGQNLYGCTGTNTWTLMSSNCAAQITSTTVVTVTTPCSWVIGGKPFSLASPAVFTLSGNGSATVYFWGDSANLITAGNDTAQATVTPDADGNVVNATEFPTSPRAVQLATVSYSGTPANWGTLANVNTPYGVPRVTAGSDGNISVSEDTDGAALLGISTTFDLSGKSKTVPNQVGTNAARPTTSCSPGQLYYQTDGTSGLYVNSATGTCSWAAVGGSSASGDFYYPVASSNSSSVYGGSGFSFTGTTNISYGVPGGANSPPVISFAVAGNSDDVVFWWPIPPNYTGGAVTLRAYGSEGTGSSNGQIATLLVRTDCIVAGGSVATTSYGSDQELNTTFTTAGSGNEYYSGSISSLTMDSCTAAQVLKVSLRRTPGTGTDTLTANYWLLGLRFSY